MGKSLKQAPATQVPMTSDDPKPLCKMCCIILGYK